MKAGVYLRISEDRDGTQTATERQRQDCAAFVEHNGWELADVFEDVDLSAFKKNVKRPAYERLIAAVAARQIDCVVAWHMDRLTRSLMPYARLMEACDKTGAFIATVDGVDTRTSPGRFHADILVGHARMSSEDHSRRIARKHVERAVKGLPNSGGTRLFGYTMDRMTVIPEEAVLVRELVTRVIACESIRGICKEWETRGVVTPTGRAWRPTSALRFLKSAAPAGMREHQGVLSQGCWPAIITPDELHRLRAVLNNPGRRTNGTGHHKYLLSGFLRCGLCGEPMIADPVRRRHALTKTRRYRCRHRPGSGACGKLGRMAEPIEDLVRESIFEALDGVDLREYVEKPCDGTGELVHAIRADEEKLAALAIDYADDRITRAEWFKARDRITGRLEENRRKLAKSNGHGFLNNLVGAGEEVRRQWDDRGLDWQRAIIAALIDRILLRPAIHGRTTFDKSLVDVIWRF